MYYQTDGKAGKFTAESQKSEVQLTENLDAGTKYKITVTSLDSEKSESQHSDPVFVTTSN